MEKVIKFINCNSYDFKDNNGQRLTGFTCNGFDPDSKRLVKVRTKHMINAEFGDDIMCKIIINGRYVNFEYID